MLPWMPPESLTVTEVRTILLFQIWLVTGFLSQLLLDGRSTVNMNTLISVLYMALGPLNVIRIIIKKTIKYFKEK